MTRHRILLCLATALSACSGKDGADDSAATGDDCAAGDYADALLCTAWMLNEDGETAAVLQSDDGSALPVNVTSVGVVTEDGEDYVLVRSTGIPNYTIDITDELISNLDSRPFADTDFTTGETTVAVGETIAFGTDIGYDGSRTGCPGGAGDGWWPPGPECPSEQDNAAYLPLNPEPEAGELCEIGLDTMGVMVNGTSLYHWWDGQSYADQGVWHNLAAKLEGYDVDLCGGHGANGDYHHHTPPSCLALQIGDEGDGHSPVFGFAADGYPIYGWWYADGVEAQSCWKTRDYSAGSETGCGEDNVRDCLLVDSTDPGAGTTAAEQAGPDTDDTVTSLSGNTFGAVSGIYYEDYYFDADCAVEGGAALDAHNGHDHGEYGYHYHLTTSFPYTPGPYLYGRVHDNSFILCTGTAGPGGGPGGG